MKRASPTRSARLAEKLKQIREKLGLSQNELLDRLGFSDHLFRSNISQYERGHRVPSPLVLLEYARIVNVDLAVLIDDQLDLPERLPGSSKREGLGQAGKVRKKR
ncbi:MAG TPA: helix-turn-helix transcriptional regulator [Pyrinomonadaceae bacterium]|nr:helix-turn-helix transcriptional regulator [Pyrinomonadaceae bacterium]